MSRINVQSPEQRMTALALANEVRVANGKTLKAIGELSYVDGVDRVISLLLDADVKGPFGSIPIYRLLKAPYHMGDAKVRKLLSAAGVVSGDRKVRQLTVRQRSMLVECLRDPTRVWRGSDLPRQRVLRDRAAA